MRYRTKIYTQIAALIVAGMILAGMTPCIAAAQAMASLEEQLQAQYSLVKMGGDSNGPAVIEPGTVLIIQKGGILGVPYGNMNLLAAKYQGWREGGRLSSWARTALPIAIDIDVD